MFGYWAFRPAPIPRSLQLDERTVARLSRMQTEHSAGSLERVDSFRTLTCCLRPYLSREALASNRIEGTQASLSDVFDADVRL